MGSKRWGGGRSAVVGKSLECSSLRRKAKQKQTTVSVNTGKLEAWRPSLTQHLRYSMVISQGCRVVDTLGTPFGDPSCRHVCGFIPRLTRIGEANLKSLLFLKTLSTKIQKTFFSSEVPLNIEMHA